MKITCDKGHEHPAWWDSRMVCVAERVGTCYLIVIKVNHSV